MSRYLRLDVGGQRLCGVCKEFKDIEEYNVIKSGGNKLVCFICYKLKKDEWRHKNMEKHRNSCQQSKDRLKLLVFNHYSNGGHKCACDGCDFFDIRGLTIDHINGTGNEHRKTIAPGRDTYQYLKDNGFPDGYQVLCGGCNLAKAQHKECPINHHEAKPWYNIPT